MGHGWDGEAGWEQKWDYIKERYKNCLNVLQREILQIFLWRQGYLQVARWHECLCFFILKQILGIKFGHDTSNILYGFS